MAPLAPNRDTSRTSATGARVCAVPGALSLAEYVRQTMADRALTWRREQDAFREMARRRGCTREQLLERGFLTDEVP